MAFHTPGGGEMQLLKYREYLEKKNIQVDLFDLWNPKFKDYDVFHFFSCISGSSHLCNFVKRLDIPVVITSSLWITDLNKSNYPCDEIKSHLSLADKIITNSVAESDQLSRILDIPIESFDHVYNGVDDIFYQQIEPEIFRSHFNVREPFILNVGNIEPRKNQLALAEVAKQLNIKLILIGHIRDALYANQLFSLYSNSIMHLGAIPHSKLLVSAYRACEVFCLPSILETPGLAALEALSCGARLVITSEGSTREYFGDFAFYVNPHSLDSIKVGIEDALRAGQPSFGFEGTKFHWESTTNKLLNIYRSIIDRK